MQNDMNFQLKDQVEIINVVYGSVQIGKIRGIRLDPKDEIIYTIRLGNGQDVVARGCEIRKLEGK